MSTQNPEIAMTKPKSRLLKLTAYSFTFLLIIPLLTVAIEPSNPSVVCERFLATDMKLKCEEKAKADDIDWYAANACNNIGDDEKFFTCWDTLKGAQYNPEAMELCTRGEVASDEQKMNCFNAMRGKSFAKDQLKSCAKVTGPDETKDCLIKDSRLPASTESSTKK